MQLMIHLINMNGNPRWVNNILIYNQFTLSKSFEKSTLRIIPLHLWICRVCKTSCAVPTTSWIWRSCRKENCSGEICLESMGLIQFEIIFVMILYMQLHNKIGLYSSYEAGLSDLGMSAIKVEVREAASFPFILVSPMNFMSSAPRVSKKARKNSIVHPYGPGLFYFLNHLRVASSYPRETSFVSSISSSWSTNHGKSYATWIISTRFTSQDTL